MRWMHLSDIHLNKEFNDMMSNVMRYELPQYISDYNIKADYLLQVIIVIQHTEK